VSACLLRNALIRLDDDIAQTILNYNDNGSFAKLAARYPLLVCHSDCLSAGGLLPEGALA
jgi:hypothetical protein